MYRILNNIHVIFFGHPMSDVMKDFLKNSFWSVFGSIVAMIIIMPVSIISGRILGPAEFGKYSLVLTLSGIIVMIMQLGLDVTGIRIIIKAKDSNQRKNKVSTVLFSALLLSVLIMIITYILKAPLAYYFKLSGEILFWAIIISIFLSNKQILDSIVRALEKYKHQALIKITESVFLLILLLILAQRYLLGSYIAYIGISILSSILAIFACLFILRGDIGKYNFKHLLSEYRYASLIILGNFLGIVFNSLDKLFIGRYLGYQNLGVYNAYLIGSFAISSQITMFFINVFFPTITRHNNFYKAIINKVERLVAYCFVPCVFGLASLTCLFVKLFGRQYPLSGTYIILFSLYATLQVPLLICANLISAYSHRSLKQGILVNSSINFILLAIYIITIPFFGFSIPIVLLALIIRQVLLIFSSRIILYRLIST